MASNKVCILRVKGEFMVVEFQDQSYHIILPSSALEGIVFPDKELELTVEWDDFKFV